MSAKAKVAWELACEAVIWFSFVGGFWANSYAFDVTLSNYDWSPVGWPRAILLLAGAIVLVWFALRLRRLLRFAEPPASYRRDEADASHGRIRTQIQILATFALPLVYLWLLPRAGFFVTTPLFVAGYMFIFGQRKLRHLLGTTSAFFAGVVLIFSKWLFVPLPLGDWPLFYAISNALLDLIGAG